LSATHLTDQEYEHLSELRHQLRRFLAFSEGQARGAKLEPQQHQLLLAVRGRPSPPTVGELAERLVLRHHSVVELIDRLERRSLVRRVRSTDDRRVAYVELTATGRALLERLSRAHRDELRRSGPGLVRALGSLLPHPRKPS
jgi:DNA-binding MarR family transcriptional regulator